MRLVAADALEAPAVGSAGTDLDAAVALTQHAGGGLPLAGRPVSLLQVKLHDGTVREASSKMQPLSGYADAMKRTDTSGWPCTVARSVDVLGDHWNLLLIRQACLGMRRFDDFQSALGIGRNILTQRLTRLVDEGVLTRVEYQQNPLRYEYRLTDKGRDAYPILAAIAA